MTGLVVDSSALVAIVLGEEGADELDRLLGEHDSMVSAATLLETSIVVEAREGLSAAALLDDALRYGEVEVVEIDEDLARLAVRSWRRYGKGNHRAALNFGDCFVHALASDRGLPILCVGDDFVQTDVEVLPAR